MKSKKKNKSKHQSKIQKAPIIFSPFERVDLGWVLLQYKREQQQNPGQTFENFLMNQGARGLLLRIWFSTDSLFSSPEKYVCVWHGTSLSRAVQILTQGFKCSLNVYTSFEPYVCLEYAQRRARSESDFPALIACILERLYVQKCLAEQHPRQAHLVFKTFPQKFTKLVFIPPETEVFVKNPALETWEIYTHTPELVAPSQDELDAILDSCDKQQTTSSYRRKGGGMKGKAINKTPRRLRILGDDEIEALYGIPRFTPEERLEYFSLSSTELASLEELHSIKSRIYYILQLGYFKARQMFFVFELQEVLEDRRYIIEQYFPNFQFTDFEIT